MGFEPRHPKQKRMKANEIGSFVGQALPLNSMKERRDLILIMVGRGLQIVTGLAGIRLMTSVLSPEEMGRYYILLSLITFFALFLVSPIGNYINRKTHEWHRSGTMQRNLYLYWLYLFAITLFDSSAVLL
ncbi:MAG: hypothetical protein DDT40_01487 [candidate division WS2 bacterium]|nr:hypothetical protein [Candidatus Psychracetigena formicireducens]